MTFWDDIGLLSGIEFKRYLDQALLEMETRMGAREDAAYSKLNATIGTVKEGWAALQAENTNLKSQLDAAGVEFQAALDADSDTDAGKVEAADTSLSELVAVAEPEVPVDPETPVDGETPQQ